MNFTDFLTVCKAQNTTVSVFVGKDAKRGEIQKALKELTKTAEEAGYTLTAFKNYHPAGGGIVTVSFKRADR